MKKLIKEKEEEDAVCEFRTNKKNSVAMKTDQPHVFL